MTSHFLLSHPRQLVVGSVVCAAVLAAGFAATRIEHDVAEAADPPQTATVERRDLVANETLDGTVENVDQIQVSHRLDEASVGTGASAGAGGGAGGADGATTVGNSSAASVGVIGASLSTPVTPTTCDTTSTDSTSSTTIPLAPTTVIDPPDTETSTTETSTTETSTTIPPTSPPPPTPAMPPTSDVTTSTGLTTSTTTQAPSTMTCIDGSPTTSEPPPTTTQDSQPATPNAGVGDRPSATAGSGGAGFVGAGSASAAASSSPIYERVTSLAPAGSVLEPGDIIYTVNGQPVVAMLGSTPAWRDLTLSSDDGADILQLETTLAMLGYDDAGEMVVDEVFDSHTRAAVQAWQVGLGLEESGEVTLGDVVFLPTAATVNSVNVAVGDDVTDGTIILTIDAQRVQIRADVPTDLQPWVAAGTLVSFEGGESSIERLVSSEVDGSVVDGEVTVQAILVPGPEFEAAAGTTLTLRLSEVAAPSSLIVPASAISSLIDGSYVVRLVDGETLGSWVVVVPTAVVGGEVAVASENLVEGALIAIP